jgi:hypothetical protein
MMATMMAENGARLSALVTAKATAERVSEEAEPMLPVSAGRFLSEPVLRTGSAR